MRGRVRGWGENIMKKFLAAFALVLVASTVLNFVIHGVLLKPLYQQSAQLMRDEADSGAHAMFLLVGFVFFSLGFVWIYARGVEAKPWVGQGLRYGVAVWLIAAVSRYSIYYAIQPWPAHVVLMQIGYELVTTLALGLGVAVVYRS
jgi:apolipoprotein N-acyltransferase